MSLGEEVLDLTLREMWSFVAESFCWFLNHDVDLDDDVDTTILFDEINCAGVHISNVLKTLWAPMQSDDPEARTDAVDALCRGHVPDFICVCSSDRAHIAELAIEASVRASMLYRSFRRIGVDDATFTELEFALDHLDTIVFLTDPDRLEPDAEADAEERAYLSDVREACRRDVEEARERVRAERIAASN